jgi:Immunity protein 52
MEQFYLNAHWPARREDIQACADRLIRCLEGLQECSSVLTVRFGAGGAIDDVTAQPFNLNDTESVMRILERGRHRTDIGDRILEDLGCFFTFWNGREGRDSFTLMGNCGLFTTVAGLVNTISLQFPAELGELRDAKHMAKVLAAVVQAWEPDDAGVISEAAVHAAVDAGRKTPDGPFVDWMLYMSRRLRKIPVVPPPSVVEPVGQIGWLVVVQPEPVDLQNPIHVKNVRAVEMALNPSWFKRICSALRRREHSVRVTKAD